MDKRTRSTRSTRSVSVSNGLSEGLRYELQNVAMLNIPGGLAEHDPVAALQAFQAEMDKPVITVKDNVLYVNGIAQPSGTISLTGLLQLMQNTPPARGGARKKKTT